MPLVSDNWSAGPGFRAERKPTSRTSTDVLVIGAGIAGLRAAIAAAQLGARVTVAASGSMDASCTARAQGGVAAVRAECDSFESHAADTMRAGDGLCDPEAVQFIVRRSGPAIEQLLRWAMRFDVDAAGNLALGLEGAHSHPRILHAGGDETGAAMLACLVKVARATPGIRILEGLFATDLIRDGAAPDARVIGTSFITRSGATPVIHAGSVVLAAGGAAALYRETTNPSGAVGSGIAMAWRAGATVADMAFIQFHPTVFHERCDGPRMLISEAVRGEGAVLLDAGGVRFMKNEHPLAELAPRDVVSRAIARRLMETGTDRVYLDATTIRAFPTRFPVIAAALRQRDIDPSLDRIPVSPAAHYTIGGVVTDHDGRTDLPGLYAAGEVASTGLHGANRLASNSLLEGLVMGEVAGVAAAEERVGPRSVPRLIRSRARRGWSRSVATISSRLPSLMWEQVGLLRDEAGLRRAIGRLEQWRPSILDAAPIMPALRLRDAIDCGLLIARSALWRSESRGCHWRRDHPQADGRYLMHDRWKRGHDAPEPPVVQVTRALAPAGLVGAGTPKEIIP